MNPSVPQAKSVGLPTTPVPTAAPTVEPQPESFAQPKVRRFLPTTVSPTPSAGDLVGMHFDRPAAPSASPQLPTHSPPSFAPPQLPTHSLADRPDGPSLPTHSPPAAVTRLQLPDHTPPPHSGRSRSLPEYSPPPVARPSQFTSAGSPVASGSRQRSQRLEAEHHRPSPIRRTTTVNDI